MQVKSRGLEAALEETQRPSPALETIRSAMPQHWGVNFTPPQAGNLELT